MQVHISRSASDNGNRNGFSTSPVHSSSVVGNCIVPPSSANDSSFRERSRRSSPTRSDDQGMLVPARVAFTAAPYFSLTPTPVQFPRPRTVAASSAYADGRLFRLRSASLSVWAEKEAKDARRDTLVVIAKNVVASLEGGEVGSFNQRMDISTSHQNRRQTDSRERRRLAHIPKIAPTALGTGRNDRELISKSIKFRQPRSATVGHLSPRDKKKPPPLETVQQKNNNNIQDNDPSQLDNDDEDGDPHQKQQQQPTSPQGSGPNVILTSTTSPNLKVVKKAAETPRENLSLNRLLMIPLEDRTNEDLEEMARQLLPRSKFLRSVPHDVLIELCRCMTLFVLEKNEPIFREGDVAHEMYIVLSGKLDLYQLANKEAVPTSTGISKSGKNYAVMKATIKKIYEELNEIDGTEIPLNVQFGVSSRFQPLHLIDLARSYGMNSIDDEGSFLWDSYQQLNNVPQMVSNKNNMSSANLNSLLEEPLTSPISTTPPSGGSSSGITRLGSMSPFSLSSPLGGGVSSPKNVAATTTSGPRTILTFQQMFKKKKLVWHKRLLKNAQKDLAEMLEKEIQQYLNDVEKKEQVRLNSCVIAGSALGEIAMERSDCRRTATPIASMQCEMLRIGRKDYKRILRQQVDVYNRNTASFLSKISIFQNISLDVLVSLVPFMKELELRSGVVLFREGELSSGCLYFVQTGEVSFFRSIPKEYEKEELKETAMKQLQEQALGEMANIANLHEETQNSANKGKKWRPKQIVVGRVGKMDVCYMDSFLTPNLGTCIESAIVTSANCTVFQINHVDVRKKMMPLLGTNQGELEKLLKVRDLRHKEVVNQISSFESLTSTKSSKKSSSVNLSRVLSVPPPPLPDKRFPSSSNNNSNSNTSPKRLVQSSMGSRDDNTSPTTQGYSRLPSRANTALGLSRPAVLSPIVQNSNNNNNNNRACSSHSQHENGDDDDEFANVPIRKRDMYRHLAEVDKYKPTKVAADVEGAFEDDENDDEFYEASLGGATTPSTSGRRGRVPAASYTSLRTEDIVEGIEMQERMEQELRDAKGGPASFLRDHALKKAITERKELLNTAELNVISGARRFKTPEQLHRFAQATNSCYSIASSSSNLEKFDDKYRRALEILRSGMEARIAIERNGRFGTGSDSPPKTPPPIPSPADLRKSSPKSGGSGVKKAATYTRANHEAAKNLMNWMDEQWKAPLKDHLIMQQELQQPVKRGAHLAIDTEFQSYTTINMSPRHRKHMINQMGLHESQANAIIMSD